VAPRHLLDTRLNPPADLRATVPLDALQPAPARKSRRLLPLIHQ